MRVSEGDLSVNPTKLMKSKRFKEAMIIPILKAAEAGMPVSELMNQAVIPGEYRSAIIGAVSGRSPRYLDSYPIHARREECPFGSSARNSKNER